MQVAADFRLASAVHWRLDEHGLLPRVPEAVRDWAEGAAELGRLRVEAQRAEAMALARLMEAGGIRAVLLKGTAAVFDQLYPDPGARYSGDIDVLVPADRLDQARALLQAEGFAPIQGPYAMTAWAKHLPRLAHPARRFGVELHQNLVETAFQPALPSPAILARARAMPVGDGLEVWLPAPEDRLVHCLAHLMDDRRQSPSPLPRQMLELRLLAERSPPNWPAVAARFRSAGIHAELLDTLATAEALVGLAWPRCFQRPRLVWRWRLWQQVHLPGLARAGRLLHLAAPLIHPRRAAGLAWRAARSGDLRAFIAPRLRDLRDRTGPRA